MATNYPFPLPSQNPATRAFEAFIPNPPVPPGVGGGYGGGGGGSYGDGGVAPVAVPQTSINPNANTRTTTLTGGVTDTNSNPLDVSTMEQGINAPDPTALLLSSNDYQGASLSDKLSLAAKSTIGSNQQLIDSLLAQQQKENEAKIPGAEADVNALKDKYGQIVDQRIFSDKLKEVYDKFELDQKIRDLTDIQNKIVSAKDALDQGLIYEGERPIRLDLISGRQATLKAQGLATIGTLQASAQVIQGNINLAYSYADATISALRLDTDRSMKALDTLLGLANDNLVNLKKDERDIIDARLKNLQKGIDEVTANKDKITDLMIKYPTGVVKGGVNFLDNPQQAILKILPTLSEQEQVKLALDQVKLQQAKLTLAQSKAKGAGGGSGSGSATAKSKAEVQKYETLLLQGKSGGMPYAEAIIAFGDVLPISYINSIYPQESKQASTLVNPQQQLENQLYGDVVNNPNQYNTSFDKNGKVVVQKKDQPAKAGTGGVLSTIGNAAKSVFNFFTGK